VCSGGAGTSTCDGGSLVPQNHPTEPLPDCATGVGENSGTATDALPSTTGGAGGSVPTGGAGGSVPTGGAGGAGGGSSSVGGACATSADCAAGLACFASSCQLAIR